MRKHRVLSLLTAAALICSMSVPARGLAQNAWEESEQSNFWNTNSIIRDDVVIREYDSSAEDELRFFPYIYAPEESSQEQSAEQEDFLPLPSLEASAGDPLAPADSSFVLSGDELVKYQGKDASVTVPEGVRVIGGGAFSGNKTVTSVFLPDSVEEIEGGAFQNCANLQFVFLTGKSKLAVIGAKAFVGCPLLNSGFAMDVAKVAEDAFYQQPQAQQQNPFAEKKEETAGTADKFSASSTPSLSVIDPFNYSTQPEGSAYTGAFPGLVQENAAPAAGSLTITRQPESVTAEIGDSVAFIVVAQGTGNIQYQWMQSRDGISWNAIESSSAAFLNAATNVLSFTVTDLRATRIFKCAVTDGVNTVYSNAVSVLLAQPLGAADASKFAPSATTDPSKFAPSATPDPSKFMPSAEADSSLFYPEPSFDDFPAAEQNTANWGTVIQPDPFAPSPAQPSPFEQDPVAFSLEEPYAPLFVSAQQESGNSARISWSEVPFSSGYELYCSVNGTDYDLLATVTETSYLHTNLDFTNTYGYAVRAVKADPLGGEPFRSNFSTEALLRVFPAPSAISAWQETENSASILWSLVDFATGYELYRSVNGQDFTLLATLTETKYVDSGLDFLQNTYSYKVVALRPVLGSTAMLRSPFSVAVKVEEPLNNGKEIEINGIVYKLTDEGAVVIAYHGSTTELRIPSEILNQKYTVVGIGSGVFRNNKKLKSIALPYTIKYIETAAFAYCSAIIDQ